LAFERADGGRFHGRMRLSKTTRLGNATMIRFRDGVLRTADGDVPVTFRPHGSPLVHALSWPEAFAGWVGKTVFERQIEDFVAAARGERPPRVPTAAGVDQARLAEALYAARQPLTHDWRAEAA
jgi:predicted dehydrogenase